MLLDFQKKLESLWLICLLDSHLSTYVCLFLARSVASLWCAFMRKFVGFGYHA